MKLVGSMKTPQVASGAGAPELSAVLHLRHGCFQRTNEIEGLGPNDLVPSAAAVSCSKVMKCRLGHVHIGKVV